MSGIQRGFYTHGRAFHGVVNHSSYAETLRRLPNATFENATDVVGHARYVKSARTDRLSAARRGDRRGRNRKDDRVGAARYG